MIPTIKVDILISKNQALQILYLTHHDNVLDDIKKNSILKME